MRLGFLGSPALAVPVLAALVDAGHDIEIVVSRPDRPRGRGHAASPTAVKAAAMALGLRVTDDLDDIAAVPLDACVVVAYGVLVPERLLAHAPMLNTHFSLLPRWRGAAPVERAILAGDEVTGVCIMALEAALDTGPIYASSTTLVDAKTLDELRSELVERSCTLLVDLLAHDPLPTPSAQVGEPTYARKVTIDELALAFDRPAAELARVVRLGRAHTTAAGRRLVVRRAEVVDAHGEPGSLDGDVVACGVGGLRLIEVIPEGRRAMPAAAWLRGLRGGAPSHLGARIAP